MALNFNTIIVTALGLVNLFLLEIMLANVSVPCYTSNRNLAVTGEGFLPCSVTSAKYHWAIIHIYKKIK